MKETQGPILTSEQIMYLSYLATAGIVIMWISFWYIAIKKNQSILDILRSQSFFKTVSVIGIIAATAVLSLAGRIEGQLTAAILSGIVGYILGSHQLKEKEKDQAKIN